jgi:MOSC domain-containing protein YiiM
VAEVVHLFQSVAQGEPVREYEEVYALENKGFKDCLHGRSDSSRQVLLMDIETLEEFSIPAGSVKENITTSGIELSGLLLGQHLRAGEALLEITKPCTPCHQMDEIRAGLQDALRGRRGILCRVVESGKIRRGDRIELMEQRASRKSEARNHAG